jgi:cytochrome c biogenesis protein ResB
MTRAEAAPGVARPVRVIDLLVWLWRLLASAQFAVAVIALLAAGGLLAVSLPQIPPAMRGNLLAIDAWLAVRKGDFGPLTEPMYRLGLFDVVRAWWFLAALGVLAVSIGIYLVDRSFSAWRNITRPRLRLPDSFFERAANRAVIAAPASIAHPSQALEGVLRRRRFHVRSQVEGDAVYFFADRFAWAQLGSFVTHAAVVLFLVGGLTSHFAGYTQNLFIAEGTTDPVFPVSHHGQMQIAVVDAVAKFDAAGVPRDYRTDIVIYQDGHEVKRGVTTVNRPLTYGGYGFHQSSYFGQGAALRVRDVTTGNTRYDEVLALSDFVPAAAVEVRDGTGKTLLSDVIVPTDFIGTARGTLVTVPGDGRQYWVGVVPNDDQKTFSMVVYGRQGDDTRLIIPEGKSQSTGRLAWKFVETQALPSIVQAGVPGDSDSALIVMAETPQKQPYLTVLGAVDGQALTLYPNQPARVGDNEYTFGGRREFAGISVRRDPGAKFIWIATGFLIAGLLVTFYVPRLRVWARVRGNEMMIAAQAERRGPFQSEMKRLQQELGALEAAGKRGDNPNV